METDEPRSEERGDLHDLRGEVLRPGEVRKV